VGTLRYGASEYACSVADRTLAHLQIVIITKLRHGESFCYSCTGEDGRAITLWLSPMIPLRFEFAESSPIPINRAWLSALERAANTVNGLWAVDEPVPAQQPSGSLPAREFAGVRR